MNIQWLMKRLVKSECTGESEHCFLDASGSPVSLKRSLPELNVIFIEMSENE